MERRKTLVLDESLSKQATTDRNLHNFQFCDLFLNSKYRSLSSNLLHPKTLTRFLFSQFDKTFTMKNNLFLYNFKTAALFVLKRLVQKFQNEILGIKIMCSGK
jgi:hypothetical protein